MPLIDVVCWLIVVVWPPTVVEREVMSDAKALSALTLAVDSVDTFAVASVAAAEMASDFLASANDWVAYVDSMVATLAVVAGRPVVALLT
jgi:hypothetical protein